MSNSIALLKIANKVGATLLPDSAGWKNRFEIKSESSSRLYVIAQRTSDNTWGCSCPGWKMAKGGVRSCKHLTTMMPHLIAVDATPESVAKS